LNDCSGVARSGEAIYIMGSSGSGKTTLLNVLCDRLKKKGRRVKYSGDVLLNGKLQVTQQNFSYYGAYVMQDDILFPTLTCEECLMFAASMKLNIGSKQTKKRV
jgi:ABC-type multidrug transport system ATPase subunit